MKLILQTFFFFFVLFFFFVVAGLQVLLRMEIIPQAQLPRDSRGVSITSAL